MNLSGSPLDYLLVFIGGITLSFTPCVYPLIPVTAGYIGIHGKGSHLRGFLLSFTYVSGLACTYAVLGLVAALTGKLFGRISGHPLTLLVVGAVFVLFGFSMFDVFAAYFPTIGRLAHVRQKGFHGAFVLGAVSGLIASPCVAPALGAILIYIGTSQNMLNGAGLLVTFAYGMGLTLILAGTFSTVLLHFPRSGKWMVFVERFCATVLIALGVYFIVAAIRRF